MLRKYKRIVVSLLLIILLINTYASATGQELDLIGEAGLVIDPEYNAVLYEKNMDKRLFPASTTKMMTAILVLENANLNDIAVVDQEVASSYKGSHIALDFDEEMSVDDLLHALLIASANDAALTLAKHVSGSIDEFVNLMNAKAKEIGANNTHFVNPHGLHDENHYTTAYDLYLIAKYAMSNDKFKELVNMSSYVIKPTNKKEERYIHSTNRFLTNTGKMNINGDIRKIEYDGVCGVKTGFTDDAGNCLVTFAQRNGRQLYSVVLKSKQFDVYSDTYKLLDYGFNNTNNFKIGSKNEFIENISIKKANIPYFATVLGNDIYYPLKNDENKDSITKKIIFNDDLKLPIKAGDNLGKVEFFIDDQKIGSGNILSTLDVEPEYNNFLDALLSKWYIFVILFLLTIQVLQVIFRIRRRNHRRRKRSSNIRFVK